MGLSWRAQLRQAVIGVGMVAALCLGMVLGDALADHEQPRRVCEYDAR